MEVKHLQKAIGMVGINANEHQVELIIEFYSLLQAKGDSATLGDIEEVGQRVNKRQQLKQGIKPLMPQ